MRAFLVAPSLLSAAAGRGGDCEWRSSYAAARDTVRLGDVTRLRRLLDVDPALVTCREAGSGFSLIHWWSIGFGPRLEILNLLVASGAAVDALDSRGRNLLHLVLVEGEDQPHPVPLSVIDALLAYGLDPAVRDHRGRTPCDYARDSSHASTRQAMSRWCPADEGRPR